MGSASFIPGVQGINDTVGYIASACSSRWTGDRGQETAVTLEMIQQYKTNAASFISSAREAASVFA